MHIAKIYKKSQDYEGYASGDIAEQALQKLDSSDVDVSQLSGSFSRVNEAKDLVNQFDGSLLANVAFIFNFGKGGAYGVYLSSLDRDIQTKALRQRIESQGYQVDIGQNGELTALPKEGETQEDIQFNIDQIWNELKSKGGTAFGINMGLVLGSAKQDAANADFPDPDFWEWVGVLHLGSTIVHEAVHAKGNEGEGPSEQAEAAFMNWALPQLNQKYKQHLSNQGWTEEQLSQFEDGPIVMTGQKRHAKKESWYKEAQASYIPKSFLDAPSGSDLSGRHTGDSQFVQGRGPWGLDGAPFHLLPIEKKLGRQYMAPIPEDLIQDHDVLEEQLRKYTRDDEKLIEDEIIESLLSQDHDDSASYRAQEELLDDTRPKPLLLPLKKASGIVREATLFGWWNNLEVSDGSTIPGMGDRVMAWDDRDESFAEEEEWISKQYRYNPTYDVKGFYYRWIEPHFKPELWDKQISNYSPNTHPAKRFASANQSENEDGNRDIVKILSVLGAIQEKIRSGKISNTRLVVSEDVLPLIDNLFVNNSDFQMNAFDFGTGYSGDQIYAVWISSKKVDLKKIKEAENCIRNKAKDENGVMEELFGHSQHRKGAIREIIKTVRHILKEYGIRDVYLVGGHPRELSMGKSLSDIKGLGFSGAWRNQSLKVGGLLAERLGVIDVEIFHRTGTLSFVYKGVKVDFKGNYSPVEIRKEMREQGIPTSALNMDIYNRDFTINMLIYDILSKKIYDPCKCSLKDIKGKLIRTFFDADNIVQQNPIIILRALKYKIRYGFDIDPELYAAMRRYKGLLFDGRYTDERLKIARENIKREGSKEAESLFVEFGLEKL